VKFRVEQFDFDHISECFKCFFVNESEAQVATIPQWPIVAGLVSPAKNGDVPKSLLIIIGSRMPPVGSALRPKSGSFTDARVIHRRFDVRLQ
jgi:hypothetical protein